MEIDQSGVGIGIVGNRTNTDIEVFVDFVPNKISTGYPINGKMYDSKKIRSFFVRKVFDEHFDESRVGDKDYILNLEPNYSNLSNMDNSL